VAKAIPLLENPYPPRGRWFKGAFHFHSTNSDGALSPAESIRRYADAGFDVIGLSDHGCVSVVPDEWFPGRLLVPTAELSWPHILHIDANARGVVREGSFRDVLARIRREHAFGVFCHPGWSNHTWQESLGAWPVDAVEIYNHVTEIENATGLAVERWDMLLQAGRRVWGFADDDSHFRPAYPQFGGGYVMIRAPRLTRPDIMRALKAGSFYSRMGPEFREIRVARGLVTVRTSPAVELRAIADGVGSGCVYFSKRPCRDWTVRYDGWWTKPRRYLRLELRDAAGKTAWSNPLFVKAP
jgi:hypothetical protein